LDNLAKWVKVGLAVSVIWTFLIFLVSKQGFSLINFNFEFHEAESTWDASLPVAIGTFVFIWIVSFFFFRDEEEE
jgi:hypothetical protein